MRGRLRAHMVRVSALQTDTGLCEQLDSSAFSCARAIPEHVNSKVVPCLTPQPLALGGATDASAELL